MAATPAARRSRRFGGRRRRFSPPRTGTARCGAAAGWRRSDRGLRAVLHPVAGLRPTRRLKRPAHPDGHRCGVPQFAGVLSVQGPDALHNGGQLGAAPHAPVDETSRERTWSRPKRPGMWRCRSWPTGSSPDRLSSSPRECHANAPLRDCHISDTFPLPSPSHKDIVRGWRRLTDISGPAGSASREPPAAIPKPRPTSPARRASPRPTSTSTARQASRGPR